MSEWAPQAKTVYMAHADAMPLVCEATEIFENKFGCTVKAGWCCTCVAPRESTISILHAGYFFIRFFAA